MLPAAFAPASGLVGLAPPRGPPAEDRPPEPPTGDMAVPRYLAALQGATSSFLASPRRPRLFRLAAAAPGALVPLRVLPGAGTIWPASPGSAGDAPSRARGASPPWRRGAAAPRSLASHIKPGARRGEMGEGRRMKEWSRARRHGQGQSEAPASRMRARPAGPAWSSGRQRPSPPSPCSHDGAATPWYQGPPAGSWALTPQSRNATSRSFGRRADGSRGWHSSRGRWWRGSE